MSAKNKSRYVRKLTELGNAIDDARAARFGNSSSERFPLEEWKLVASFMHAAKTDELARRTLRIAPYGCGLREDDADDLLETVTEWMASPDETIRELWECCGDSDGDWETLPMPEIPPLEVTWQWPDWLNDVAEFYPLHGDVEWESAPDGGAVIRGCDGWYEPTLLKSGTCADDTLDIYDDVEWPDYFAHGEGVMPLPLGGTMDAFGYDRDVDPTHVIAVRVSDRTPGVLVTADRTDDDGTVRPAKLPRGYVEPSAEALGLEPSRFVPGWHGGVAEFHPLRLPDGVRWARGEVGYARDLFLRDAAGRDYIPAPVDRTHSRAALELGPLVLPDAAGPDEVDSGDLDSDISDIDRDMRPLAIRISDGATGYLTLPERADELFTNVIAFGGSDLESDMYLDPLPSWEDYDDDIQLRLAEVGTIAPVRAEDLRVLDIALPNGVVMPDLADHPELAQVLGLSD